MRRTPILIAATYSTPRSRSATTCVNSTATRPRMTASSIISTTQGSPQKRSLLQKPMTGGRFTSPFGFRYHPILGYGRPHTGVDWADKVGSPIFSAGNGTVLKASWDSGYGNRVEIQHTNGYVTTYNHMSAFAKGITPGTKVRQGQIIGFLGSTG